MAQQLFHCCDHTMEYNNSIHIMTTSPGPDNVSVSKLNIATYFLLYMYSVRSVSLFCRCIVLTFEMRYDLFFMSLLLLGWSSVPPL